MTPRSLISALILALAAALPCFAEGNPYAIDQQCYEYFRMAENLVDDTSNNAFEVANDALLKRAVECGDEKARTLHFVGILKRATRLNRHNPDRLAGNNAVEAARRQLMTVASETGYMQYFYYAYELAQTYYVNTRQEGHAQNLLQEMLSTAQDKNDDYGLWQGERYIATLYHSQNDFRNSRRFFQEAIRIYERSQDPLIRRQSLTRVCCDLAETYPVGSDSARLYIRKAEETAYLHQDTLRCYYYKSQLAALDGKPDTYSYYRDYCLGDPNFPAVIKATPEYFECVEGIMANSVSAEEFGSKFQHLKYVQQMVFLRELAFRKQRWDIAATTGNGVIQSLYSAISRMNDMRIEEVSAAHGNYELSAQLARQQKRTRVVTSFVLTLVIVILAGVLAFVLWRYRKLRAGHLILKRKHSSKI